MDFDFLLLWISSLVILTLIIKLMGKKDKELLHKIFIYMLLCCFFWSSMLVCQYYSNHSIFLVIYIFAIYYLGFTALLVGIVFSERKLTLPFVIIPFGIQTIIALIVIINERHTYNSMEHSIFYWMGTLFNYIFTIMAIYYLVSYSIKKKGLFSKQSILIIISWIIPMFFNFMMCARIVNFSNETTPASFAATGLFMYLGIIRFNFLKITPVALEKIFDLINEAIIVIDIDNIILQYNSNFLKLFKIEIKSGDKLFDKFKSIKLDTINSYIQESIKDTQNAQKEFNINIQGKNFFLDISLSKLIIDNQEKGFIIIIKDITEKKLLNDKLIHQEKLLSLGHLIGGVSHNLQTPIMSSAGGVNIIACMINIIKNHYKELGVENEEIEKAINNIYRWTDSIEKSLVYMSDVIKTLRRQTSNSNTFNEITVDRLINDILLLINFEVKRHSCILKINTANVDTNKLIKNDTVTLTQVINNLISNAIDSYNKEPGVINFNISEVSDMLILSVQDNGCGIDKEIQTKLFKQMITTKGMDGMGLGLFLSKTMLHARCNGKILFSSEKDKGTTMVVKIPFENTGGIQDVEEN